MLRMQTVLDLRRHEWDGQKETKGRSLTNATTEPKDRVRRHWGSILELAFLGQEPFGLEIVDIDELVLVTAHRPIHDTLS